MPGSNRIPRKTVVSANRGRRGPFGAFVTTAAADPLVARGLALAYASLDAEAREKLIDVIVHDAHAEGISVSGVLAALLAVEEDTRVAQQIADAIQQAGGAGLESTAVARALVAGDQERGGVVLIRPLHGTFVEVLALSWERVQGITRAIFDPLVHDGEAALRTDQLPAELAFEEMPVAFAIDLVAPALWNHRRLHGALPPGVRRFADLFSILAAPDDDFFKESRDPEPRAGRAQRSSGGGLEPWEVPGGGTLGE